MMSESQPEEVHQDLNLSLENSFNLKKTYLQVEKMSTKQKDEFIYQLLTTYFYQKEHILEIYKTMLGIDNILLKEE